MLLSFIVMWPKVWPNVRVLNYGITVVALPFYKILTGAELHMGSIRRHLSSGNVIGTEFTGPAKEASHPNLRGSRAPITQKKGGSWVGAASMGVELSS
jgi:hypothetical protein